MTTNQLVEWEVGVGFYDNMGQHIRTDVWYFVAYTIEEAQELFDKEVIKVIDANTHGTETCDYSHEWLSMCAVDQATWEPKGEPVQL